MEKRIKEKETRHQKVQDEMMAHMENKYGETFKGDSIEYIPRVEGGWDDVGVVIPDKLKETYVNVYRLEDKDGKVTFSDDYQSFLLGNDFFEYVNDDIRKVYPKTFSLTDIEVLDNNSGKFSFEECKKKSDIDLSIVLYVTEKTDTAENIKKNIEKCAMKYHKEFNNASLLITVFWTNNDEIETLSKLATDMNNKQYYIKRSKLNSARGEHINEDIEPFDVSINVHGKIEYRLTGTETRRK